MRHVSFPTSFPSKFDVPHERRLSTSDTEVVAPHVGYPHVTFILVVILGVVATDVSHRHAQVEAQLASYGHGVAVAQAHGVVEVGLVARVAQLEVVAVGTSIRAHMMSL